MEDEKNYRNYYAIIPANVRYDEDLSPNAKLLYGEITALCNEKGYCWATNQYFSTLYNCSDRTIQNLLKQLASKGYIDIKIVNNTKRLIYINFTRYENNFAVGTKKISYGYENFFTHNNTKNNKMNNKDDNNAAFFDCDWLS